MKNVDMAGSQEDRWIAFPILEFIILESIASDIAIVSMMAFDAKGKVLPLV